MNEPKEKITLKEILSGKISKSFFLKRVYPILTSIVALGLFIAYLIIPPYPEGKYSWFLDTISGLGDYIENPNGWWGFSIAMVAAGFLFLIWSQYIYHHLSKICIATSRLASLFFMIGFVGLFIIAVITDTPLDNWIGDLSMSDIHTKIAMVVFASIGVGLGVYWFVFVKDESPKLGGKQQMRYWKQANFVYLIFFLVVLGVGISQLIRLIKDWGWIDNGNGLLELWTRFQVWEWLMLFMLFIVAYLLIKIIPEKMDKYEKEIQK